MPFQRASDSDLTYRLKWAAWEWLYNTVGCRAIGFEVGFEGPAGRIADVAGLAPGRALYLIEVKVSRPDLFRDDHDGEDLERLRSRGPALQRMAELAQEIADLRPLDSQATLEAASLERQWERLPERVAAFSTKFRDPRYVCIADYNYIMAPRGLIRRVEMPPLWGLLDPTPEAVLEATRTAGNRSTGVVSNILRAIARANTRDMMRAHGVEWGRRERGALFPHGPEESSTETSA